MRRAFSLLEVVFVIVIIGILAAVAIPKLNNVGEQALANGLNKVLIDAQTSIPPAFVNLVDMELNTSEVHLDDLLNAPSHWTLNQDSDVAIYNREGITARIELNVSGRTLITGINWSGASDDIKKAFQTITGNSDNDYDTNESIPF